MSAPRISTSVLAVTGYGSPKHLFRGGHQFFECSDSVVDHVDVEVCDVVERCTTRCKPAIRTLRNASRLCSRCCRADHLPLDVY